MAMPLRRCPLCSQPLPEGVTQAEISSGIQKLASGALIQERKRIEEHYKSQLAAERSQMQALAEKRVKARIEERLRREMTRTVRATTIEGERKLERIEADRKRERLRSEAEATRLRAQLDTLSRKLEKQTGEQRGEEGELDLYTQLRQAFPGDRIGRIGKGIKGADIVQEVMDGTDISGRIIYESKNVAAWQNAFLRQALKYRTQYETPFVLVVSRVFPKKEREFCVIGGIPIVTPRMAVSLASVMRDSIIDIARLRVTGTGRDDKAQEILGYIASDRFATRFNSLAECISSLRDQQNREKRWHENTWAERSTVHDRLDQNHREIDAHLKSIVSKKQPVRMAARA
jgi:hypothetical protein